MRYLAGYRALQEPTAKQLDLVHIPVHFRQIGSLFALKWSKIWSQASCFSLRLVKPNILLARLILNTHHARQQTVELWIKRHDNHSNTVQNLDIMRQHPDDDPHYLHL